MVHRTLKSIRFEKGLSQKQMADKLFIEQSTLSKYENNQLKMNDDITTRISETFDIPIDELRDIGSGNAYFENGSKNNGNGVVNTQQYYHVPKELLDSIIQQQNILTGLLKQMMEKSK